MILTPCLERRLVDDARNEAVERLVVGAVVRRNGRTLLLRRRHDDFMGGRYELPSGLVEPCETLEEALRREVVEETRLQVTAVKAYLGFFDYVSGGGRASRQFNFLVAVGDFPYISLSEHDAFAWVQASGVERLRISEAVRRVLAHPVLSQITGAPFPRETSGPAVSRQSC